LFIAALLNKSTKFTNIIISAIFAGLHVIILVLSTDLGSALIFFIVYVIMIFVATGKYRYLFAGVAGGALAAIVGYRLFYHIRTRVAAFLDPWSFIDTGGYQVAQSLFAIGTGGFLGLGLYKGLPKAIPLVEQDFMFSAISEELGGFFGICLIFLYMSCFICFIKISINQKGMFYKLTGLGLSVTYVVQTILTIGGAIKFIPSTGVTLPLISYGGSSVLCTMIMFAMFQGLEAHGKDEATMSSNSVGLS
jgi:cell division protein FtsW (lipid II flippase)